MINYYTFCSFIEKGRIGLDLPSLVEQEVPAEPRTAVVAKLEEEVAADVLDAGDTAVEECVDLQPADCIVVAAVVAEDSLH